MSGQKRKLSSRNTTGYTGVYKNGKRFQARITIDRKTKALGTYDTPKEAALAYDRAVIKHKLSPSQLNFPSTVAKSKKKKQDKRQASGTRKTSKRKIQSRKNTTNNVGKWSTKEQALFKKGYKKWGPDWIKIADMVKTRNNKQVCSHSLVVQVPKVQ